jgi:acyl-CoA synthetase (AMP-forming)/AMP-acid ligase II
MLYERWREVVRENSTEIAVRDSGSGVQWTFAQIDQLSDKAVTDKVLFPQGAAIDFIVTVLRGWRADAVIYPLEPDQRPIEFPLPPPNIAHIKVTSATTGPARLVALTAGQLAADARSIADTMGLRREWPNIAAISLAHSYGFSNLITPLLLHGIPIVVASSALPESIGAAVRRTSGVTLPGVPALWRAWCEAGVLAAEKIRLAISAGAPLPLELEQQIFQRCAIKVHNFYGSSECGGIAYDATTAPRSNGSCVGTPMKNVAVAVGENGCLEVRSDAVAETYWPESSDSLRAGRFRTNDLAEIIDGAVYLRGRASDVINVAGRKVSPETIESALARHSDVRDCVVFSVAEPHRERIVACVSLSGDVNSDQLKQFLLDQLPSWQVPRDFWFVESLSPDNRGKLSRAAWRAKYLSR